MGAWKRIGGSKELTSNEQTNKEQGLSSGIPEQVVKLVQAGLSTPERKELAQLRRDNRRLRMEREILSKAAAWFARETDSIPSGSSNS